jgi:hypothetical protein
MTSPTSAGTRFKLRWLMDARFAAASTWPIIVLHHRSGRRSNDFPRSFEQSVSLINENGIDLDGNPVGLATSAVGTSAGLPNRQYDCSRINCRR